MAAADGDPFDQETAKLVATLNDEFAESWNLENAIRRTVACLRYPVES